MAKPELKIKAMSAEQRTIFDTIWSKFPNIEYDDFNTKLETFTVSKPVFWSTRNAIKSKIYSFSGIKGGRPSGMVTRKFQAGATGNGHDAGLRPKLFNYYPLAPGQVEIVKRLDYEGYSEEDIKLFQQKFPSLLAQIFDTKATFKFFKISEDDGNGNEIKQLELRRLS